MLVLGEFICRSTSEAPSLQVPLHICLGGDVSRRVARIQVIHFRLVVVVSSSRLIDRSGAIIMI